MSNATSLGKLIERAAAGVIETQQEVFDVAYAQELERFADVLGAAPSGLARTMVEQLLPVRQRVAQAELEFGVSIEIERRGGYSIGAKVLNLGYERRYGFTASESSRVRVTVQQVALGVSSVKPSIE